MPIYAYKCGSCGFSKDVLQKISEPPLVVCPACGEASFSKQVTAAGFQLKGSGWYVTDFKGAANPPAKTDGERAADDKKAEGKTGSAAGQGDVRPPAASEGADAGKAVAKSEGSKPSGATDAPAKPPTAAPAPSGSRD